jgi:hypothetical protein
MKRVRQLVAVAIGTLSLAGCLSLITGSQIDAEMKRWVGSSTDQLVKAWGPPTSTLPGGVPQGGEIWAYKFSRSVGGSDTYADALGQHEYVAIRQFYIDSAGIIYAWWWQEPTGNGNTMSSSSRASSP